LKVDLLDKLFILLDTSKKDMDISMAEIELDPEEKQKRIDRLLEHTKEEIATQWLCNRITNFTAPLA